MSRILGLIVIVLAALGITLWTSGSWPFAQASQDKNPFGLSSRPGDWDEPVPASTKPPKVHAILWAQNRALLDPITMSDITVNLVEEQDVSPRVDGQILDIYVEIGSKVHKG